MLLKRELGIEKLKQQLNLLFTANVPTNVKSNNYYEELNGTVYRTPIFLNDKGESELELMVAFPKNKYVKSSVIGVASLSFV